MPVDPSLIGRTFPPTAAYEVTEDRIRAFTAAVHAPYDGTSVPPTFPIVMWFDAMNGFLQTEHIELSRIIHGEQKFAYERPLVVGDVLTTQLSVASVRQIGGNDIVGTVSEFRDADGRLVCTSGATLVHRGADA
jgi:acyl dehydratase